MRHAVALALLAAVLGACSDSPDDRRGEDPKLLVDRIWVDRLPEKHTDYMQAMFVIGARPLGVFQKASSISFSSPSKRL